MRCGQRRKINWLEEEELIMKNSQGVLVKRRWLEWVDKIRQKQLPGEMRQQGEKNGHWIWREIKQDARRHDLERDPVRRWKQADKRLGGDRLKSRLAMCANVADKRCLHVHILANGTCVSAAIHTPTDTPTVTPPNAFCLDSHANLCVTACVCASMKCSSTLVDMICH